MVSGLDSKDWYRLDIDPRLFAILFGGRERYERELQGILTFERWFSWL